MSDLVIILGITAVWIITLIVLGKAIDARPPRPTFGEPDDDA